MLLGSIATSWERVQETLITSDYTPSNQYSILIPFRNEEDNLPQLLQSLDELTSPGPIHEILFIDDHSEDKSCSIIRQHGYEVIKNKGQGKKAALNQAIKIARNNYIITIDADVTVHPDWLRLIDSHICIHHSDMVIGAVRIDTPYSIKDTFEVQDTNATIALTAAGIINEKFYLGNGANLIFKKELFLRVGGYSTNLGISSGDDVFLINEFKEKGYKITYLKSLRATVTTYSTKSWRALQLQRKRWATKTKHYANSHLLALQGLIFVANVAIPLHLLLIIKGIGEFAFIVFIIYTSLKLTIDHIFLQKISIFYKNKGNIFKSIVAGMLYPIYFMMMAWWAFLPSKTVWKNRTIR